MAVGFQSSIIAADGGLDVDGISLVKLDGNGNETGEIPVSVAHLMTLDCVDTGSPAMLLMFGESLEAGRTYKLKLEAGCVKNAVSTFPAYYNDAQELTFTTGDDEMAFSGGTDFSEDSFYGRLRAGEKVWASSKYKKYMDMTGGELTYQWYRGASEDATEAVSIEGATDILYEPVAEDVGKYLFLGLTFNCGEGSASYSYSLMSPALGPVDPAYLTDSSIESISVKAGGTDYLTFDGATKDYNITVPTDADTVTVDVGYDSSLNSAVMINGIPAEGWEEDGGLSVGLNLGDNVVAVQSVSENYLSFSNYIIHIYRDPRRRRHGAAG